MYESFILLCNFDVVGYIPCVHIDERMFDTIACDSRLTLVRPTNMILRQTYISDNLRKIINKYEGIIYG